MVYGQERGFFTDVEQQRYCVIRQRAEIPFTDHGRACCIPRLRASLLMIRSVGNFHLELLVICVVLAAVLRHVFSVSCRRASPFCPFNYLQEGLRPSSICIGKGVAGYQSPSPLSDILINTPCAHPVMIQNTYSQGANKTKHVVISSLNQTILTYRLYRVVKFKAAGTLLVIKAECDHRGGGSKLCQSD